MLLIKSVSGYVNMLALKKLATDRLSQPYSHVGSSSKTDAAREVEAAIKAQRLGAITAKLKAGKRLSASDMEYLRKNAPTLYETALRIKRERDEYRTKLRRCRSKEEVRSVQMGKYNELRQSARSSSENAEELAMRAAAVLDEDTSFFSSAQYKQLPAQERKKKRLRIQKTAVQQRPLSRKTEDLAAKNDKKLEELLKKHKKDSSDNRSAAAGGPADATKSASATTHSASAAAVQDTQTQIARANRDASELPGELGERGEPDSFGMSYSFAQEARNGDPASPTEAPRHGMARTAWQPSADAAYTPSTARRRMALASYAGNASGR